MPPGVAGAWLELALALWLPGEVEDAEVDCWLSLPGLLACDGACIGGVDGGDVLEAVWLDDDEGTLDGALADDWLLAEPCDDVGVGTPVDADCDASGEDCGLDGEGLLELDDELWLDCSVDDEEDEDDDGTV